VPTEHLRARKTANEEQGREIEEEKKNKDRQDTPLLLLYSMTVAAGRPSTVRRVSLRGEVWVSEQREEGEGERASGDAKGKRGGGGKARVGSGRGRRKWRDEMPIVGIEMKGRAHPKRQKERVMKYNNMEKERGEEEGRNVRSRSGGTERQEEKVSEERRKPENRARHDSVRRRDTKRNPPNPLPHLHIVHAVPQRNDVLALPHADRASADLGRVACALPTRLRVRVVILPALAHTFVGGQRATPHKRLPRHSTHKCLPHAVRDALAQPYNPLAPGYI
jgi:hypothetical protein